jgi:hypothetical protein
MPLSTLIPAPVKTVVGPAMRKDSKIWTASVIETGGAPAIVEARIGRVGIDIRTIFGVRLVLVGCQVVLAWSWVCLTST